jgi:hypothetical protein
MEVARQAIHTAGQRLFIRLAARDHERDARFINQDRIGFIDHRGGERAMNLVLREQAKLVAKIVEADLVRRGVGNIAGISALALFDAHALLDAADRESQEFVNTAHPFGIAPGQVVVHGHHMNTLSALGVPGNRRDGGERLSLSGLHFGDPATGQRQWA